VLNAHLRFPARLPFHALHYTAFFFALPFSRAGIPKPFRAVRALIVSATSSLLHFCSLLPANADMLPRLLYRLPVSLVSSRLYYAFVYLLRWGVSCCGTGSGCAWATVAPACCLDAKEENRTPLSSGSQNTGLRACWRGRWAWGGAWRSGWINGWGGAPRWNLFYSSTCAGGMQFYPVYTFVFGLHIVPANASVYAAAGGTYSPTWCLCVLPF
jgi:hypothetical protein